MTTEAGRSIQLHKIKRHFQINSAAPYQTFHFTTVNDTSFLDTENLISNRPADCGVGVEALFGNTLDL